MEGKVEIIDRKGNIIMENKHEGLSGSTDQSSSPAGGPQFNEKDKSGWRGWVNRYGSSVILPIIALLILAGGIYLYANQKTEDAALSLGEDSVINQEEIFDGAEESAPTEEVFDLISEKTEEEEIEIIIPESRKESGSIIEKAAQGDSVTRLARRALKSYTENNSENLTNEHKIYIEDYLKDQIGSRPLEVGEEIAFSEDLIKEAIDASLELSPEQLKNLEKYSALVISW